KGALRLGGGRSFACQARSRVDCTWKDFTASSQIEEAFVFVVDTVSAALSLRVWDSFEMYDVTRERGGERERTDQLLEARLPTRAGKVEELQGRRRRRTVRLKESHSDRRKPTTRGRVTLRQGYPVKAQVCFFHTSYQSFCERNGYA
ncbi:unnamed protein product, partial [Hapterophycus canaliculatus]